MTNSKILQLFLCVLITARTVWSSNPTTPTPVDFTGTPCYPCAKDYCNAGQYCHKRAPPCDGSQGALFEHKVTEKGFRLTSVKVWNQQIAPNKNMAAFKLTFTNDYGSSIEQMYGIDETYSTTTTHTYQIGSEVIGIHLYPGASPDIDAIVFRLEDGSTVRFGRESEVTIPSLSADDFATLHGRFLGFKTFLTKYYSFDPATYQSFFYIEAFRDTTSCEAATFLISPDFTVAETHLVPYSQSSTHTVSFRFAQTTACAYSFAASSTNAALSASQSGSEIAISVSASSLSEVGTHTLTITLSPTYQDTTSQPSALVRTKTVNLIQCQAAFTASLSTFSYTINTGQQTFGISTAKTPSANCASISHSASVALFDSMGGLLATPSWLSIINSDTAVEIFTNDRAVAADYTLSVTVSISQQGLIHDTVTQSIALKMVDPCATAAITSVLLKSANTSVDFIIGGSATSEVFTITDSASTLFGMAGFCGDFAISFGSALPSFASYDSTSKTITASTANIADTGATSLLVTAKLLEDPSIALTITMDLNIICTVASMAWASQIAPSLSHVILVDPSQQENFSVILSPACPGVSVSMALSCPSCGAVPLSNFAMLTRAATSGTVDILSSHLTDDGIHSVSLDVSYNALSPLQSTIVVSLVNPCKTTTITAGASSLPHTLSLVGKEISGPVQFGKLAFKIQVEVDSEVNCGSLSYQVASSDPTLLPVALLGDEIQIAPDSSLLSDGCDESIIVQGSLPAYPGVAALQIGVAVKIYTLSCSVVENTINSNDSGYLKYQISLTPDAALLPQLEIAISRTANGQELTSDLVFAAVDPYTISQSVFEVSVRRNGVEIAPGSYSINLRATLGSSSTDCKASTTFAQEMKRVDLPVYEPPPEKIPLGEEATLLLARVGEEAKQALVFSMNSTSDKWTAKIPIPDQVAGEKIEQEIDLGKAKDCLDYWPAEKELTLRADCNLGKNGQRFEKVGIKLTTRAGFEQLYELLAILKRFDEVKERQEWLRPPIISAISFEPTGKLAISFNASLELEQVENPALIHVEWDEPRTSSGELMVRGRPAQHSDSNCNVLNGATQVPLLQVFLDQGPWPLCDESRLGFTYTAMNFTGSQLLVNVTFDNPNCISQRREKDQILVVLKAEEVLVSARFGPLNQGTERQTLIPYLVSDRVQGVIGFTGKVTEACGSFVIFFSIGSNFFVQAALNRIVSVISVMQILSHLMLIGIRPAPHAQLFYSFILKAAAFGLIDFKKQTGEVLGIPKAGPVNKNFFIVGYESSHLLTNLSTLVLFTAVASPLVTGVILVLRRYCRKCPKIYACLQARVDAIFWNEFIMFIAGDILLFTVSAMINIRQERAGVVARDASFTLSIATLSFLLAFSVAKAVFVLRKRDDLSKLVFVERVGALYEGLAVGRKSNKGVLGFIVHQDVRVYVIAFVVVFFEWRPDLQLLLCSAVTLAHACLMGHARPNASRIANAQDLLNEFGILVIIYHMLYQSDLISQVDIRAMAGWSLVGFTLLLFLANLVPMGLQSARSLVKEIKRRKARYQANRERRKSLELAPHGSLVSVATRDIGVSPRHLRESSGSQLIHLVVRDGRRQGHGNEEKEASRVDQLQIKSCVLGEQAILSRSANEEQSAKMTGFLSEQLAKGNGDLVGQIEVKMRQIFDDLNEMESQINAEILDQADGAQGQEKNSEQKISEMSLV